jgi:DNA-binding transcriptional ArsR family regulator
MGVSRTDLFDVEQNEIAQLARVLSHPARIAILQHMAESQTCINGDLVEQLGLAQPTVSQHLRELKLAGIIKGTIVGNSVAYCIDTQRWMEVKQILTDLFDSIQPKEQNC